MCYKPRPHTIPEEKKQELLNLQNQILDKKAKDGVIDDEVVNKIKSGNSLEAGYAAEREIKDYQEMVRRAMRMLYQHDEASSLMIKRMEQAIDCQIVDFEPMKALRHDFLYYLQYYFNEDRRVIKVLTTRDFIDAPIKHTVKYEKKEITKEQLETFRKLLDEGKDFELDGDNATKVPPEILFVEHEPYRLKVRFAIRAMIKSGVCPADQIPYFEEFLGLPILGKIE